MVLLLTNCHRCCIYCLLKASVSGRLGLCCVKILPVHNVAQQARVSTGAYCLETDGYHACCCIFDTASRVLFNRLQQIWGRVQAVRGGSGSGWGDGDDGLRSKRKLKDPPSDSQRLLVVVGDPDDCCSAAAKH